MRIFLSSLLIPAHLLCLSLPTTGAALGGNSTAIGAQVHNGAVEISGDTNQAASWASLLSPSHIIESIQNASHAFVAPKESESPPDVWEVMMEHEKHLQDYVSGLLRDAAESFKSTNFTDITSSMHHIVNATATFRENIQGALDVHEITLLTLTEELEGVFMAIVNDLENIPPPDKAPGHAERVDMVDKVVNNTALALTTLATRYGIEEEVVSTYLLTMKPHVQVLTVTVGDINEQYPDLLPALVFSVAALLIPESWILGPFLRMFGFGPAGPVKGSVAAWLQRLFWGATVAPGSWFSLLQKAGMGKNPGRLGFLAKVSGWVVGLLATFPPSSKGQ